MKELEGKRALVTGASSGIGAATARALAARGAEVWLLARRASRLEALAAELPAARVLVADVRDHETMRSSLEGEHIDIAVLNAGLALGLEPLIEGDPEEWSIVLDTNIKGVLHGIRAVVPGMVARGGGDVVLLGSVAGRQVYPGGGVYCATKWAVRALYETLRLELVGEGVRVTTIDPGMVRSEFSDVRFRGDRERADAVYEGVDPLTPEDVADAVAYAVTRPPHVNLGEIVLWASAQASTTVLFRRTCDA